MSYAGFEVFGRWRAIRGRRWTAPPQIPGGRVEPQNHLKNGIPKPRGGVFHRKINGFLTSTIETPGISDSFSLTHRTPDPTGKSGDGL
jgi:hypothetical protein